MKNVHNVLLLALVCLVAIIALDKGWSPARVQGPNRAEAAEPLTFPLMVSEALAQVPLISPAEAAEAMRSDPGTLIIDVRDAADIAAAGIIPGAVNISLGTLTFKADNQVPSEWRDPNLADRTRHIITTCLSGEMGALAGKLLMDMGFTNVHALKGGTLGWQAAGYRVQALTPGWAYRYDAASQQWYAQHYAMTAKGLTVDGVYQVQQRPLGSFTGCELEPKGSDC